MSYEKERDEAATEFYVKRMGDVYGICHHVHHEDFINHAEAGFFAGADWANARAEKEIANLRESLTNFKVMFESQGSIFIAQAKLALKPRGDGNGQ